MSSIVDVQSDSDDSLHNLSSEQSEECISRALGTAKQTLMTEFVTLEIRKPQRPPSPDGTEPYSEIRVSPNASPDPSSSGNESDDEYDDDDDNNHHNYEYSGGIFSNHRHKLMRWAPIFVGTALCAAMATIQQS